MNLTQFERDFLDGVSKTHAWNHVKWLYENAQDRLSGQPNAQKATDYILNAFDEYGLEAREYEYYAHLSEPIFASLEILFPERKNIEVRAMIHSPSTVKEGIETELVYLKSGGSADYEGIDMEGKIALVESSYDPPSPEKARIAEDQKCAGLIMMNWGLPEHDSIANDVCRSVWGRPTTETIKEGIHLPNAVISRKSGEYLMDLCKKGKVVVRLVTETTLEWKKIRIPMAYLKNEEDPHNFIIVAGHMDAWEAGVTCNATGISTVLEMARLFSRHKDKIKRSIWFVCWPAHEDIMEGSTWFVDQFWDEIRNGAIMYFNADSPGMGHGADHYMSRRTDNVANLCHTTIEDIYGSHMPQIAQWAPKVSDQSFFGVGVPSILYRMNHSPALMEKWNNATLGWWYHSRIDDLDKADAESLYKNLMGYALTILRIGNLPIIPVDFVSTADTFKKIIEDYGKDLKERLNFDTLMGCAEKFREDTVKLNEKIKEFQVGYSVSGCESTDDRDKSDLINFTLRKLSNILIPIDHTYTDPYNQDPYGAEYTDSHIPVFYKIKQFLLADRDEPIYSMLEAELIKHRNRVSDALSDASWYIDQCLNRL